MQCTSVIQIFEWVSSPIRVALVPPHSAQRADALCVGPSTSRHPDRVYVSAARLFFPALPIPFVVLFLGSVLLSFAWMGQPCLPSCELLIAY